MSTHELCPDENGRCQYGRDDDCPPVADQYGEFISMEIELIVFGNPVSAVLMMQKPLRDAVNAALTVTGNDPEREWELRTEEGRLLNLDRSPDAEGIHGEKRLTLFPRAGTAA